MLKVEEKVTFIWQNIHPEKFDPYILALKNPERLLFTTKQHFDKEL